MGRGLQPARLARHAGVVIALLCAATLAPAQPDADDGPPSNEIADFLLGERPAPAATPGEEGARARLGSAADALAPLVAELARGASVGAPVRSVALLEVGRPPGVEGWLETALAARAPARDALAAALVDAASAHFAVSAEAAPGDAAAALSALRGTEPRPQLIAELNQRLDVDAVLLAQVTGGWSPWAPPRLELHLLAGHAPVSAYGVIRAADLPEPLTRWNPLAASVILLPVALGALSRRAGGRGVLHLRIERRAPPGPSIVYTAYVARRALRGETSGKHVIASQAVPGESVVLRGLPTGTLFVAVRRVERDPKTLQVTSNEIQERSLDVTRGQPASLAVEFKADLTAVSVRLLQNDGKPAAAQAVLVVQGESKSSRYVRGGAVTLHLPPGSHVLLVGIDDRAYRLPISIEAKTPKLDAKLAVEDREKAVIAGCRDAVAPFLNGDLASAASVLEKAGLGAQAAPLRAELLRARGESAEAARTLEAAGHLKEAAAARAEAGDAMGTALLLAKTGDYEGAGRQLRAAGDLLGAARAFAQATSWGDAIACAQQSGDRALLVEILERKGDLLDAARLAVENGEPARAIPLLQGLALSHPRYGEASLLLAELLLPQGEPELALQKLDEAVQVLGSETALELREQIARALEAKGELALALDAYETIRKRDLRYPGIAEKVEALRSRLRAPAAAAPAAAAPAGEEAPTRIRVATRYEIEKEIGRGGMGVVFRARDKVLGRIVALKRLPDNLKEHPTAVKLFLREARSVAALNHPNIVTLFDAGQEDGSYYLTMEYLEGQPLHALLARRGRFSARDTVALGMQVSEGLACAHGEAIVHRDIKPSNLFVTQKGRVKIMDFGLAKTMEEVRKHSSIIAGTPYYMAPEQALGQNVDGRTDLYAFGVTLFELVTGGVPFREGDVTYHHRHTPAPDVRERGAEVPDALAALIGQLLAKRPDERPASARDVLLHLKQIARGL
jgi:hypothetical protein